MKLAIMQPYFLPYIGYFQLIASADQFIIYDNIKYTKKGWINRNRLLRNGRDAIFSLPLKKGSDYLDVRHRELSTEFSYDKLLNQFREAYRDAPYFYETFPLLEDIVGFQDANLFKYLHHSIVKTCAHLDITTDIKISSDIAIDNTTKNQGKVLAYCKAVGATTYINTIGGTGLYSREAFREIGIDLKFIRSKSFDYPQYGNDFVPWLSIIDAMMFSPPDALRTCIKSNYELI